MKNIDPYDHYAACCVPSKDNYNKSINNSLLALSSSQQEARIQELEEKVARQEAELTERTEKHRKEVGELRESLRDKEAEKDHAMRDKDSLLDEVRQENKMRFPCLYC